MGVAVGPWGLLFVAGAAMAAGLPAAPSTSAPGVCHACSVLEALSRTGLISGCAGPAQLWVRRGVTIRVLALTRVPWGSPRAPPARGAVGVPQAARRGRGHGPCQQLETPAHTLLFLRSVGVRVTVSGRAAFSVCVIFPQDSSFGAEHVKTTCPV